MDYDENDFQGHNLQLTGEGSSKFSPVLRPYVIPKFDFDDNLQGHLRFDGLVENEVFLGIPGQEDNQWIEDFSRVNSGIAFSSSAVEPCSISRRNNVWSEATSSESVEMLLKSVGQEEVIRAETITEELDGGNELGKLTMQRGYNSKQNEAVEESQDFNPVLPSAGIPGNLSGLNGSDEIEPHHVKQVSELSANLSSDELNLEAAGGNHAMDNLDTEEKCTGTNKEEADASVKELLINRNEEHLTFSGIQTDIAESSLRNVSANAVEVKEPEIPPEVSDMCSENASGLSKDIEKAVEESHVQGNVADLDDQTLDGSCSGACTSKVDSPLCVASKMESGEEHSFGTSIECDKFSSLELKVDYELHSGRECSGDILKSPDQGRKSKVTVVSEATIINQQLAGKMLHEESPVPVEHGEDFKGYAVQESIAAPGSLASPELKMQSQSKMTLGQSSDVKKNEKFLGCDDQIDCRDSASIVELPVMFGVEKPSFRDDDGSGNNKTADVAKPTEMSSPAELVKEKLAVESSEVIDAAPGVCEVEKMDVDNILPPVLSGTVQMGKESHSSDLDDVHDCDRDVPFLDRGNVNLPIDSSNMEPETVVSFDSEERGQPLVSAEESKKNVERHCQSEVETIIGAEPGVSSHSECVDTTDEIINHNEVRGSPSIVQENDFEAHKTSSSPTVKDDSQMITDQVVETQNKQDIVSGGSSEERSKKSDVHQVYSDVMVEEGAAADTEAALERQNRTTLDKTHEVVVSLKLADAILVHNKSEDSSLPLVERSHDVGQKNNEDNVSTVAPRVDTCIQITSNNRVDISNDLQAYKDHAPSSEFDANCTVEGGGSSAKPGKPDCNLESVTTSTEVLQSKKDNEKDVKKIVAENILLSDVTDGIEGKVTSISMNSRVDASKEERGFTFDVSPLAGLSEGETGKAWQSFPSIRGCKTSMVMEGSFSTSGDGKMKPGIVQEISQASPQAPDGGIARPGAKVTSERRTRRGPTKSGKESTRKSSNSKETTPRPAGKGDKPSVPTSPSGAGLLLQLEELKPYGSVERVGVSPSGVISIPTSYLPDLNTSAPPSMLFQQPFTDIQQVQLRAQIFVYGSLIQGAAPDEACMVSAFGSSDSGRSVWESAWRACAERIQGQKPFANNTGTPTQPRAEWRNAGSKTPKQASAKTPKQASKPSVLQGEVLSSPVVRVSSKDTPSSAVKPMIPLSSPLWSMPTPSCDGLQSSGMPRGPLVNLHQALSPLHPNQTPPIRNFVGQSTSWLSQSPFSVPWFASPQTSALDISSRVSALPITEAVKLTPVKESFVPHSSDSKHVSPMFIAQSGSSNIFPSTSSLLDIKKVAASPGQHSADPKSRKRKKTPNTDNLGQISLPAQIQPVTVSAPIVSNLSNDVPVSEAIGRISMLARSQTESMPVPVVSAHFSTSVSVTTPDCFVSKGNSGKFLTTLSPISSIDQTKREDQNLEKKFIISEETSNKVKEAKLQAEDAASHAATAVSHCEDIWSQLDKQKNSGLVSDVEAKLASAAVAISAAASVAKAAAAAAKIASNAAAQARQMAEEALTSSGTYNSTQNNSISLPSIVNELGKATPASILKGGDTSSAIISAAREAARRRVEAASAASKHAENLDAIVKAAELAAEAVSQAGKIFAMGDPLPLSELVKAGPGGYLKDAQLHSERGTKSNMVNGAENINVVKEDGNVSSEQLKIVPSDMNKQTLNSGAMSPVSGEISRDMMEDKMNMLDNISGSVTGGRASRGQRHRAPDQGHLPKTIGVVPESEIDSMSNFITAEDEYEKLAEASKENIIREGSLVEVFKDGGYYKASWFLANVSSLKDGRAFVCYAHLQSNDETAKQLKEWVPLESESSKFPLVRIAHPAVTMQFEGTRKRQRAAIKDYVWSVGDRVDAWMQDRWREGIIKEKDKKDETTFTVHFPDQGEIAVVRSWHLRPTLLWKDGEWIEWSREESSSHGDTPNEKRLKLGTPAMEVRAKDKAPKDFDLMTYGKQDELRLLPLSTKERTFNVGKNTTDENKLDTQRTARTGLQKEGSRVVFGVPKPGKKRKFMEVSKHYTSDRSTKTKVASDSSKVGKYLMPQATETRAWRNNSKVDYKEKQAPAGSKARVFKSGKPPGVPSRTLPQKDNLMTSAVSSSSDTTMRDHVVKENDGFDSGERNQFVFGSMPSNTEGATEAPLSFTARALPPGAPSKMFSTSDTKSEQSNKSKLAPAGGKAPKVETKDKLLTEVEPRRSNRRIQPTSRLLEGLQSSLIISKVPSISHDKNQRNQSRGASKGSNNNI